MKTIVYEVHGNLYINLTNRCPSNCVFCLRNTMDSVGGANSLWLDSEPTIEEVISELNKINISDYKEIVFCGFGEPTERLEDLLIIAKYIKENFHKSIRVNTNGLSDLIHQKDTTPMFKDLVDTVSVSLNTPDRDKYYELTRNKFGKESFDALLTFVDNVKHYVPNVILTTVSTTLSKEEEDECQKISDRLGVTYRIRPWEE